MAGADNGSITWKVLASASVFVLWSILAYLAVDIRTEVGSFRGVMASQNTLIEVMRQRVEINTAAISSLDSDHRVLTREVTGVQDQIKYWQNAYGWTGKRGR
jgi:hypothetical protein